MLVLVIGGPHSRLILGTLDTMRHIRGSGPDQTGPHGLLPPIQRETLAFERPWEAGLQWTVDSPRVTHDTWIHWQRLNTREHRELFDGGVTSRVRLSRALTLGTDLHVVHQGGQLSTIGPVSDSVAAMVGVKAAGRAGFADHVTLEGSILGSRFVPDRGRLDQAHTGIGAFVRISAEDAGWRVHGILWRASDFIKAEGDLHYQSLRRDGTIYRGLRDYAEAGLTRTVPLARNSFVEASVRWHRVESDYEYSFRVLGVAQLRRRLTR